MKIALCISGQPRVWKKTYQNWIDNILPDIEKDVFFHLWDFNTLPENIFSTVNPPPPKRDVPISEDEKHEIINAYKPKKFCFDSRNINVARKNDPSLITEFVKKPLGWWCRSQYYSLWHAARLKRQYELEHNFQYDIVIRLRTDIFFARPIKLENVTPNIIYSNMNGYIENYLTFVIGDIFYYSDSFTYDQISEYIWGLNYIDTHDVVPTVIDCPPPEVGFFPYIKSKGIKNVPVKWFDVEFKIMRSEEYFNLKTSLLEYETV
jgi:hypothetical protein